MALKGKFYEHYEELEVIGSGSYGMYLNDSVRVSVPSEAQIDWGALSRQEDRFEQNE